jgi:ribosomal protein S18 acetylase RimI-like enzyme
VDVLVEVLRAITDDDAEAISHLVPQVSSRAKSVPRERVVRVATSPSSCIVVARIEGRVVASATLLTLVTLVGQFGYVEEVAVDESMRGLGIGRMLLDELVAEARHLGLDFVELTSRSTREAANALYRSMGFRLRETNVYRLDLR